MKQIIRETHIIDAEGKILGRMATQIAIWLMGKHKPAYEPNLDLGDFVTIKNASKVVVTGKKSVQKLYIHHSTHPGGLKERSYKMVMAKNPKEIVLLTVNKMLPKNKLRALRLKRLKIEK